MLTRPEASSPAPSGSPVMRAASDPLQGPWNPRFALRAPCLPQAQIGYGSLAGHEFVGSGCLVFFNRVCA